MLVYFHNRSFISTTIAVIRCREDGTHMSIMTPIVTLKLKLFYIHDQLMCPRNHSEAIGMVKLLRNVMAENIASPSRTDTPTIPVLWV